MSSFIVWVYLMYTVVELAQLLSIIHLYIHTPITKNQLNDLVINPAYSQGIIRTANTRQLQSTFPLFKPIRHLIIIAGCRSYTMWSPPPYITVGQRWCSVVVHVYYTVRRRPRQHGLQPVTRSNHVTQWIAFRTRVTDLLYRISVIFFKYVLGPVWFRRLALLPSVMRRQ